MTSVGTRGKDIYVAITAANTEREPLGLPSVWPKSNPPTNHADDISQMNFTNSTDYFYALYDGDHAGERGHNPYVRGFDYSKLAGAGVPAHSGKGRLKPDNNMWTIVKNLREDMEEIIPILVTRNLAAESLVTDLPTMSTRPLCFDEEWNTPFRNKGFVVIRKGGGIFNIKGRYARVNVLYGNQSFMTTVQGSHLPGLRYLTPSKEVIPSEASYQACAASYEKHLKGYDYDRVMERITEFLAPCLRLLLICLPIVLSGLIAAAFIFNMVYYDDTWRPELSVMKSRYWLLLWGAVTAYLYYMFMNFFGYDHSRSLSFSYPLAVALMFQFFGCLYMIGWWKKSENTGAFKLAIGLILAAPLIALLCALFVYLVVVPLLSIAVYSIFGS